MGVKSRRARLVSLNCRGDDAFRQLPEKWIVISRRSLRLKRNCTYKFFAVVPAGGDNEAQSFLVITFPGLSPSLVCEIFKDFRARVIMSVM